MSGDGPRELVKPLNPSEAAWVADHVRVAGEIVADGGLAADGGVTPETLDGLWDLLLAQDLDDPNDAINIAGLAFGQLLVERFALAWVAYTDENGTEIAVRGGGPAEFTIFPTDFVAKRYDDGITHFFAETWPEIEQAYERAQARWSTES